MSSCQILLPSEPLALIRNVWMCWSKGCIITVFAGWSGLLDLARDPSGHLCCGVPGELVLLLYNFQLVRCVYFTVQWL